MLQALHKLISAPDGPDGLAAFLLDRNEELMTVELEDLATRELMDLFQQALAEISRDRSTF
jgi:hypothetical protein